MTLRLLALLALLASVPLAGCAAKSRAEQLRDTSERVERKLNVERDRAARLTAQPERRSRLDHLTQLRMTLSAANITLATVPHLIDPPQQPLAYDVLDEVYSTIEWNIPLGPDVPNRPLPDAFRGNELNLQPANTGARKTSP